MAQPKVFVVQPIPDEGRRALTDLADVRVHQSDRMISRDDLVDGLRWCDYLLMLGDTPVDAGLMDVNPNLRGIATMAIVPNVVDVDAATARKLPVTAMPNIVARTTCDLTMAIMLGLAWRIPQADRFTRAGLFHQEQSNQFLVHGLSGKTLGLIGLGQIGELVARRAAAFDMDIVYTKRTRLAPALERELGVQWFADKDDVMRRADFLCILANYNPSTHLLIGASELALMKPTAFFINTGRGRIVDEDALLQALRDKKIAGAGLDVYWNEPPISQPDPNPAFFEFDNVILTPHIGTATLDLRREMIMYPVRNIAALIDGRRPPNIVNPEIYDA